MQPNICPFLGLLEDRETALSFPADGNYCHKADPPGAIKIEHQRVYCLTAQHVQCPMYLNPEEDPLPAELANPLAPKPVQLRPALQMIIPSGLIVLVLALLLLVPNAMANSARQEGNNTLNQETADASLLLLGSQPAATFADSSGLAGQEYTSNPTWLACTPPPNWTTYMVNDTDLLVRLSLLFRVDVDTLIVANCLPDQALVRPGEIIYIPGPTPTATVTPTPSATPTRTRRPAPLPTWTHAPREQNPNPPAPTAVPTRAPTAVPTAAPTNPPPPTNTAVPPTLPPPPTPTSPAPTEGTP